MVPLSKFVTVREVGGPARIDRLDLRPMVEITANPGRGVSLGQARWLCETRAEEELSSDYRLAWLQDLPEPKPTPARPESRGRGGSPPRGRRQPAGRPRGHRLQGLHRPDPGRRQR